ncbi:MAG TPA: TolC family protein [bacterium]|nr:TolC family protein [bacterium]
MLAKLFKIAAILSSLLAVRAVAASPEVLSWTDCVREAAVGNPQLHAAQADVRRAQAQVGAARSDFFPTLTPFTGYNLSNSSSFRTSPNPNDPTVDVDIGARHQFEYGVNLNQNIFSGFATKSAYQGSKAEVRQFQAAYDAIRAQVSFDLKTAFARLLFAQEQLGVVKKIVERRRENVRFVELRFDVGRENKGSVLRNQALLEQAEFDLAQTQRSVRVAQRELAKALGRNYETAYENLRVKGSFDTDFPKQAPDFSLLTYEHPDHRQGEAQVGGAKADVGVAKANYYPSIDADASVSQEKLSSRPFETLWSVGANLNYPFATGGGDIYQVKAAQAERRRVEHNLRSTDNDVGLRLRQAYTDFKDAVQNIAVQEKFLQSAAARAEIGRSQYANGLISYQDWDLVENDLINSQRTILETRRDALIAEANWELAQGKGAIP